MSGVLSTGDSGGDGGGDVGGDPEQRTERGWDEWVLGCSVHRGLRGAGWACWGS